MYRVIKAPQSFDDLRTFRTNVFLAGTIDNGASEDWQQVATNYILHNSDYNVMNPRREDWDSSWEQSINDDRFRQQVEWELDALEYCEKILMHFEASSMSPITLLEFGLYANSNKLVVSCPKSFWRVGNIEVVCSRHDIPLFDNLHEALKRIC